MARLRRWTEYGSLSRAVLTTIGLLAAAIAIDGLIMTWRGSEQILATPALVALSAIWVASDSGSFRWGLFVLLLWVLGFPMYLVQRESDQRRLERQAALVGGARKEDEAEVPVDLHSLQRPQNTEDQP